MTQTAQLLETLKHYLKVHGITYRNLAKRLKLSESSIKRLFSEESLSLKRLERILKVLDLDFYELARMSHRNDTIVQECFTEDQESFLIERPDLLFFLYLLVHGWRPASAAENLGKGEKGITNLLLDLDRIGLLELYANNRFRLKLSREAFANRNSNLWRGVLIQAQQRFLKHDFTQNSSRLLFAPVMLSEDSCKIVHRDLDRLIRRFGELAEADESIPSEDRQKVGLLMAFRAWHLKEGESL